ncbi:helix-turn-helix domain-containing protein [Leucobacter tenebrionis]|uniref:helix-turn-helix domain-containing protein n=1 Tax=Leucobacter tenebrionis TaxID=2873270 RepID=UPI001CA66D3E|nr:XRE family transcriptional regulator [Leucobacter tenebrionis]QZY51617.1 XRE family transcriptional regulator [Leucobacter tenebrionis]
MDPKQERIRFGNRLRSVRKQRGLTLSVVAERADMTAGALSQIERGRSGVTVETVVRIAGALGVSTGSLFAEEEWTPQPLRKADRAQIAGSEGYVEDILSRRPDVSFEVFEVRYMPGASDAEKPYIHGDSEEFLLILRGRMKLLLDDEEFILEEGDSIELQTSLPHMVTNLYDGESAALWVISPPTSGRNGQGHSS